MIVEINFTLKTVDIFNDNKQRVAQLSREKYDALEVDQIFVIIEQGMKKSPEEEKAENMLKMEAITLQITDLQAEKATLSKSIEDSEK
jgi:hypothetical protein